LFFFDLSIQPQLLSGNFCLKLLSTETYSDFQSKLQGVYLSIRDYIKKTWVNNPNSVCRVFIPFLHSLFDDSIWSNILSKHFPLVFNFLLKLKRLIASSRAVIIIGFQPATITLEKLLTFETLMDSIYSVDSFSSRMHVVPYEFREFLGFFMIRKLQEYGMLTSPQLKGTRFGIKRDRRKLHIEPLHLPPEESRATTGDTERSKQQDQKIHSTELKLNVDKVEVPKSSATIENNVQSDKPVSSLAASLAAARLAREAAKASGNLSLPQPISITKKDSKIELPKGGIDF
jgi:hypothetical protein